MESKQILQAVYDQDLESLYNVDKFDKLVSMGFINVWYDGWDYVIELTEAGEQELEVLNERKI